MHEQVSLARGCGNPVIPHAGHVAPVTANPRYLGRMPTYFRRFSLALLLAAATGALFLGAGGRLVMRLFALATGRFPTFSVHGTLNVVLAGAIAGAVGGLILFALARWLPERPWLRGLTFSAVCYLVAIPGFRPFDVVGHLIDGEETDWIPRARIILARGADLRFVPYDRFRHRARNVGRSLRSLLDEFARLRAANLELLGSWKLTARELELPG